LATLSTSVNPIVTTDPVAVSPASQPWGGYVAELRFSKVARYGGYFQRPGDPYYRSLSGNDDAAKILLHMDGTDGAKVFTESAKGIGYGAHSITVGGAAITSAGQKKYGPTSGFFSSAAGDRVQMAYTPDFYLGNQGNWTFDCWYYPTTTNGGTLLATRAVGSAYGGLIVYDAGNGTIALLMSFNGSSWGFGPTNVATVPLNQWSHVAVVLDRPFVRVMINGLLVYTISPLTAGWTAVSQPTCIGGLSDGVGLAGFLDELRFSNIARYKSNFTPPIAPYASDGNTNLLMHCEGINGATTFPDSSGSGHGNATVAGTAQVSTAQAKFGTGAAMFDGSTAWLSYPNSADWEFASGDWTIDWWEYRTAAAVGSVALARDQTSAYVGWLLGYTDGTNSLMYMSSNGSAWDIASGQSLGALELNSWHHFAVVRKSNNFYGFRDGVQQSGWQSSAAIRANANPLAIGRYNAYFSGYLDEIRVSKGRARWTADFTPTGPYA
jgi:Concanavalin A-like lectin/glucanases superfamily